MNAHDNATLFSNVTVNRALLDSAEQQMFDTKKGPVDEADPAQVPASRRRRQLGQEWEHRQCQALIAIVSRVLAARPRSPSPPCALARAGARRRAAVSSCPSGGTLKPARWEGTVKVYTDQGSLGALDNATANKLVANALKQWSSVPTSSFRAVIAGTLPFDVTGANAGQVIGASNGGGIQVIYDSDGSVLGDFMGAGPGVLGIASPEFLASRRLDRDRRRLGHHPRRGQLQGLLARLHARRADLGRGHARVRSRDRSRAHADQWLLLAQPGQSGLRHARRPGAGGAGPVRQGRRPLPDDGRRSRRCTR